MLFKHHRHLMQHEKPLSYGKLKKKKSLSALVTKWKIFLTWASKVKQNYISLKFLWVRWPITMVSHDFIHVPLRDSVPASQLSALGALETQLWKISGAKSVIRPRGCNHKCLLNTQNNYLTQIREQVPCCQCNRLFSQESLI